MSFLDGLEPKRRDHLLQLAASRLQPQPAAPPPWAAGQLSAADAARLRVRAHTLAEENASLRRNLQAMVVQAKRSEAELQALRRTSAAKQQRAEQQHATTAAVLEEQAARQQRALLDVARTAQSLAAENAQLHGRLAALQDENQDAERVQHALQERLAQLQHLCLELDRQPPAGGGSGTGSSSSSLPKNPAAGAGAEGAAADSGRQAELLERLSCTLRALGPANRSPLVSPAAAALPPAVAPGKVQAAAKGLPTDLRLALRELEGLRRERDGLAAKLKAAEAQAAKLRSEQEQARQSLVRERHATAAATAELQRQLKLSRGRSEGLAKRCKEKEAALAERDAYVAALEQRLLRRRKPGAAGTAGEASPGGPAAPAAAGKGRPVPGEMQQPEDPQGLAALSPCPGSPAGLWQPVDGWEEYAEVSLAGMQQAAEATAAACMGGGFHAGRWVPSPGADSPIPADSPQHDMPQRRLQWADMPLAAGPQQAQQQGEEEWCAYQLGSPSPCPAHHQSGLRYDSGPAAGGGVSNNSNPLFSFHPGAGGLAGAEDGQALEAGRAHDEGSTYVNDLFCGGGAASAVHAVPAGPPVSLGLPLPPHKRLGAAAAAGGRPAVSQQSASSRRLQQVQPCPGAASSPAELGALPARMPSGEFESVSALLEALTPGSQAALGAAPAEQRAATSDAQHSRAAMPPAAQRQPAAQRHSGGRMPAAAGAADRTPPGALLAGPWPVSGGMECSVERKLQDAVASFFAETAQKGGRPPAELVPSPPRQRGGRRPGSAERIAALSALAKRQQRRRPTGAQEEAGQGSGMKQGRPNRAADQRGGQRAGRGRQQQQGAGQWSPAAAVCYA